MMMVVPFLILAVGMLGRGALLDPNNWDMLRC
jgi:hypothetical protein